MNTAIAWTAEHALYLLRRFGWAKNRWQDNDGHICMGRALENAAKVCGPREPGFLDEVNAAVEKVIAEQFPGQRGRWVKRRLLGRIPAFNDDRHTTFDDVTVVLEKVAARE